MSPSVAEPPEAVALHTETPWAARFALRMKSARGSAVRELLKLTERPEVLSFAGGLPASEAFPVEAFERAARQVLEHDGASALQYGVTEGYRPLREMLARHMHRYGIPATAENVLITTGAQQGLDLVARLLLNPGDRVLTEAPTFLGAIQAFRACQAEFITVPVDDEGLQVDLLEEALRAGPKLLYVLPNFQNPTGVTLSERRRLHIVGLCSRYGVPILEDDPYGQLRYEGEHLTPLIVLDARYHGAPRSAGLRGDVLYLGTLSKTLAPGLRVGWVVAPQELIEKLVILKQGCDLHTSSFCQQVAYETARGGFLDGHVRVLRSIYGERRDAMLAALERHFPPSARWTHPSGGLFLWVTLPAGVDSAELLEEALQHDVAFVPGRACFPDGAGRETLRLNFSFLPPPRIEEGIRRLGELFTRRLHGTGGSGKA